MALTSSLTTSAAFDLLRDEVDARLAKINATISEASARHAYDQVGQLAKAAQEVADLKKELASLERRFGALVEVDGDAPPGDGLAEGKKFKKGLKTPQEAYRVPILQALVDLGGRSELHRVLECVQEMMKGRLNEHDLAVLPSDGVTPRWRNTAQWARNSLREEGLIRDDTPRAIWEISDKGREWLAEQRKTASR